MRACMLAYTNYESDNRVRRYAEALAQRGDQVDAFVLRKDDQPAFEVIDGVNVYRIQRRIVNERIPMSFLIKILFFLFNSAIWVTLKHFKNRYDVIHVHSIPDFEVFAAIVPKLLGAKCILDIHDIVPEFYADKFGVSENALVFKALIFVEKLSNAFADHVIAANDIWGERLIARSVPKDKCSVFLNYPDQAFFQRRDDKSKKNGFVMLYPGTLSPHQGLDLAVRAMAATREEAPDAQLQIYGCGSHKDALVQLTDELDVGDRVIFEEIVPISEVADVMASATVGIVPKRADTFGNQAFSTKILEFMSLGVPVLAADTMIDKYYFDDSQIQFFESGNVDDLAKSILHLYNDREYLSTLASNGSQCSDKYSWDKHKQRYFDLVDSLAGAKA